MCLVVLNVGVLGFDLFCLGCFVGNFDFEVVVFSDSLLLWVAVVGICDFNFVGMVVLNVNLPVF